ncbi:hypothetical protein [Embleya sp. NBC_00896]
MRYDDAGAVVNRETLPDFRGAEFVALRDKALEQAEPFPDWWAKYGE